MAGFTNANACSPAFPQCDEFGRCAVFYYPPKWIKKKNLNKSFDIVAIVTSKSVPQAEPQAKFSSAAKLTVIRSLKGSPPFSFKVDNLALTANPARNATKDPNRRFGLWDHMNIGKQIVTDYSSASCSREIKNSLIDGKKYLVFLKTYGTDKYSLQDAILIENETDTLVSEIEAILERRDNAPNVMGVQRYLQHMSGFVEIALRTCPRQEDYGYTDSRFETAKSQDGIVYDIIDSLNYVPSVIDLRDIESYRNQIMNVQGRVRKFKSELWKEKKLEPNFDYFDALPIINKTVTEKRKSLSFQCHPQAQYLAIFRLQSRRDSLRYLPIQNGVVDFSEVLTNIQFKGPTKVKLTEVKEWIREANPTQ